MDLVRAAIGVLLAGTPLLSCPVQAGEHEFNSRLRSPASVAPACVSTVALSSPAVSSDSNTTGTITISEPAPAGGTMVVLQSSHPAVQVAGQVMVPAGQTSASFTVNTGPVGSDTPASITASTGTCPGVSTPITVTRSLACPAAITLSNTTIRAGSVAATVTLTAPAPPEGVTVSLASNNTAVQVAGSVKVAPGQAAATFPVTVGQTPAAGQAAISASAPSCSSVAAAITISPSSAPCVGSVALSSATVTGGGAINGTVTLSAPAPAGGETIALQSSNAALQVTGDVVVPAGRAVATFTVNAGAVSSAVQATISASAGMCGAASATITAVPTTTDPCVEAVTLAAGTVVGGMGMNGAVSLTAPAPAGGAPVSLLSSSPLVQVPNLVKIAAGQTAANFAMTTTPTPAAVSATINAAASTACGASAALHVQAPTLASLALSGATASSRASVAGTVSLSGPAAAGGAMVLLESNSPLVTVPASVTIPAGQTTATFGIGIGVVPAQASATIAASFGGSVKRSLLMLQPGL